MSSKPTVGVAVITYRARELLPKSLPPLLNSPLKPKILVVNSSSNDGTIEVAEKLGAKISIVPRKQFNHGATREHARKLLGTDIVVMITPDAFATSGETLGKLIAPIVERKAAVTYAKQIPHDGAGMLESFPRSFNYPEESHIRGIEEKKKYGSYLFFCSNAFAAYCNHSLELIGGFPTVLLGEDTFVVAQLLNKGKKIGYVAEAVVKHSHRYSIAQEFRRHYDTGLAREEMKRLILQGEKDEVRGRKFVRDLSKKILRERKRLLPYAAVHTLAKWIGYKLGSKSGKAPLWMKKALTSQDFYWESVYYRKVKKTETRLTVGRKD